MLVLRFISLASSRILVCNWGLYMSSSKNSAKIMRLINMASHVEHGGKSCSRCVQLMALITIYLIVSYPIVTQAESYVDSIVINVYRDGSVSLIFKGRIIPPRGVSPSGFTSLSINSWLEFGEYVETKIIFRMITSEIAQGSMILKTRFDTYFPNRETQALNGTISLHVYTPTQGQLVINATSINVTFENKTLKYNFNGKIKVGGEGPSADQVLVLIPSIILMLRQTIEQDPKMSIVVSIKQLDMTIESDNTISITFDVDFDTYRYIELYISRDQARAYREAVSKFFSEVKQCPSRVDLSLNLSGNSLLADYYSRVECSIEDHIRMLNASLKMMSTIFESLSSSTYYSYPPYQVVPISQENNIVRFLNLTSDIVREFSENFDIAPSKASVNITLDSRGIKLEMLTPRIVKKGSTSPSDTLHALQDYVSSSLDQLAKAGLAIDRENIMSYEASIVTEEGVHVKCNQTSVSSISLNELENCTVEVERQETTISTTTVIMVGAVIAGALVGILYLVLKSKGKPS